VANTLKLYRQGAVGFIDWLDAGASNAPARIRRTRNIAAESQAPM